MRGCRSLRGARRRSSRAAPPAPSRGRSTGSDSGRETRDVRASVASSYLSSGADAIAGVVDDLLAVFLGKGAALRRWKEIEHRFRGTTELHAERSEEHTSELQSLMRIQYAVL